MGEQQHVQEQSTMVNMIIMVELVFRGIMV